MFLWSHHLSKQQKCSCTFNQCTFSMSGLSSNHQYRSLIKIVWMKICKLLCLRAWNNMQYMDAMSMPLLICFQCLIHRLDVNLSNPGWWIHLKTRWGWFNGLLIKWFHFMMMNYTIGFFMLKVHRNTVTRNE